MPAPAATSFVLLLTAGLMVGFGVAPAAATGACATPGRDGTGGTLSGILNTYYPGIGSVAAGDTTIDVGGPAGASTAIATGDLLLVIQMQDADFDDSNTSAYGHGGAPSPPASGYTALNDTGLYEYVRATSPVVGGSVGIAGLGSGGGLLNSYRSEGATASAGQRTFQLIRVPQYLTATTSSGLTALAWNGSVGGVLALDTSGLLTLGGTVSVDGLGFRGAPGIQRGGASGFSNTDVVVSATSGVNGNKGEGIGGTPLGTTAGNGYPGGDAARGAPGNAGGGGTDANPASNDQNTGGGGGGNGGAGGQGGNSWFSDLPLGGYGGTGLPATAGRVFMGGGGGSGTTNNHTSPQSDGAAGGGIVLIRTAGLIGTGSISANGADAYDQTLNDGGGGGGAGGTVVLTSPSGSLSGATLSADGGTGGDAWHTQAGAGNAHGPGGGGGGGWIFSSSAPTGQAVAGGAHGVTTTGDLPFGSFDGDPGNTASASSGLIPGVSGGAQCADLAIAKTGPATAAAGGHVAYRLSVVNHGPSDASAVSVVDTLPHGVTYISGSGPGWSCSHAGNVSVTCTRAALALGATAPAIIVSVRAPAHPGSISDTASVSASNPDPDPANDAASATTTVTASADLAIAKAGPATAAAGSSVAYRLRLVNHGPSEAKTVSVVDTLPNGATYVSASGSGWSCIHAGNTSVTCTRPRVGAGATAPIVTVVVGAPAHATTITDTAKVTAATPDPHPGNDAASASTIVTVPPTGGLAGTGAALLGWLWLELSLLLAGGSLLATARWVGWRGRHVAGR